MASSKNPTVVNTVCISLFRYTHVINSRKFRLKSMWRLAKTIVETKSNTEQNDEYINIVYYIKILYDIYYIYYIHVVFF